MKIHEKLMKSPDYFFPFSFRSAVPVQWGEIKWGVERFSGEEVVVQRSGGKGNKTHFLPYFPLKENMKLFRLVGILPF